MKNTLSLGFGHMSTTAKKYGLFALMLALITMAPAFAGADTTFNTILTQIVGWAEGSLGQVLAIAAFVVGMGIGLVRQSVMAIVIGVAFALVLSFGPGVITGIFSFAI